MGATEMTSPDELMAVLKRYLRESNESEMVVASRIGINRHTLNRWLTTSQSPTKGRLALTACFLRRVGYLYDWLKPVGFGLSIKSHQTAFH